MQEKAVYIPISHTGTLAANVDLNIKVPDACTLVYASAVASNNSDATWTIGSDSDPDYYLESETIGDSGTPSEHDRGDWATGITTDFPHIAADSIIVVTVDYDGDGGTAADDLFILLKLLID